MIGKFFSRVIKELTPADTTSVTLNATGNYNPRYGKQKIYVSGKGGAGSYTAGSAYYNYVGATNYPAPVAGTNYPAPVAAANYPPPHAAYSYWNVSMYYEDADLNYQTFSSSTGTGPVPSSYAFNNEIPLYGSIEYYAQIYALISNTPAANYPAPVAAANYPAPVAGTNYPAPVAASYEYAGTNADTANTGSSTTVFGVVLPGGYGGAASVVPKTVGSIPTYSTTPISITVPSGGYVTITFTI